VGFNPKSFLRREPKRAQIRNNNGPTLPIFDKKGALVNFLLECQIWYITIKKRVNLVEYVEYSKERDRYPS